MQLKHYPKIPTLNSAVMNRFYNHSKTKEIDWLVTEFIDGDHMALYADHKTKEFRIATRNRFLDNHDSYSCTGDISHLYKEWALTLSGKENTPIIVYGKAVGGTYNNHYKGIPIKTVCEYLDFNEFIIHDIMLPGLGFVGLDTLEKIAADCAVRTAPILYHGVYSNACGFPEDKLSAVPFMCGMEPKYDNEMKGIVIRPLYDLTHGLDRVIMKKLNRKYIGRKPEVKKETLLTDTLVEIAVYIDSTAMRLRTLDSVIAESGSFTYEDVKKVSGKFVLASLDKVSYVKYNLLDRIEKHLVHKELNRIAEDRLRTLLRLGSAA